MLSNVNLDEMSMEEANAMDKRYERKIRIRITILALSAIFIVALTIVMAYCGGGDSRVIPSYALQFGSLSIVISLVYLFVRIKFYSDLLKDKFKLRKFNNPERIEYKRRLHEKSGGDVWTITFIMSELVTVISAEYSVDAFHVGLILVIVHLLVKAIYYFYYKKFSKE